MDAKLKANFINSVAAGQEVECPECQTRNKAESKFCIGCGKSLLEIKNKVSDEAAFKTIESDSSSAEAKEKSEPKVETVRYIAPEAVFAKGLPSWSIEPPEVMVRRKH